jgi:hypothetical protein
MGSGWRGAVRKPILPSFAYRVRLGQVKCFISQGGLWGKAGNRLLYPRSLVIGITERHHRSLLRLGVHPCILFPQIKSLMFRHHTREKVLAKLITARCELEDALNIATQVARYDPVVLPESIRIKLASMIDDLNGVVSQLEGTK